MDVVEFLVDGTTEGTIRQHSKCCVGRKVLPRIALHVSLTFIPDEGIKLVFNGKRYLAACCGPGAKGPSLSSNLDGVVGAPIRKIVLSALE